MQFKPLVLLALVTPLTTCTTIPKITDTFTGAVTKVHDSDSIHITPQAKSG